MTIANIACGLFALLATTACVLSPTREFERQYEDAVIGKSFTQVRTSRHFQPELVRVLEDGHELYRRALRFYRRPTARCIVFYEVSNDVVVRVWHEGPDCWISH
jgi:hypothetical protein